MSVQDFKSGAQLTDLSRPALSNTDVLIREANHRIANALAGIAGLVRLQASEIGRRGADLSADEARELLSEVSVRIDALGRLHRLLAHQTDTRRIDLGLHLGEVANIVASTFPGMLLTNTCQGGCLIDSAAAGTIALIVSEMITNSAKHAHPAGLPVAITLGCSRLDDGCIVVVVEDDGVGLPENFDHKSDGGLGLKVIRALSNQIEAKLSLDSHALGLRSVLVLKGA
jgi:two-component sensor histidine kinase